MMPVFKASVAMLCTERTSVPEGAITEIWQQAYREESQQAAELARLHPESGSLGLPEYFSVRDRYETLAAQKSRAA